MSEDSAIPYRFAPRVEVLSGSEGDLALVEALSRLRARSRPVLLDSAGGSPCRFSLLAFDPLPLPTPEGLLGLRASRTQLVRADGSGEPLPAFFGGGFLGALAYDLGVVGEDLALPREPWGLPLVVGGTYVDFLVRDERSRTTWLVLADEPGDGRPPLRDRRERILAALRRPFAGRSEFRAEGPLRRHTPSEEHCARIESARAAIARGDIYQANVAHRFTCHTVGDPIDLYARLRHENPAPYMAFLRWDEGALLASSPELLLRYDFDEDGAFAETRPIKGTIARGATVEEDRRQAASLLASEKDLAELAMIVDLERNDLGRIARPGGVSVQAFPRLETYATVHHLVADVHARPRAGVDAVDVLASLFPGGSVTGAPKLRSMEVIAALEGEGRGFAFGSLGLFDLEGRALFNLLIRTQVWRPRSGGGPAAGEVSFRVGGGITWSSDPRAEERESLWKGAALARALGAT